MPETRQLGLLSILGLWAALCLGGALYTSWLGYGGRGFAATLTAFAFFFLVMLAFAARGVAEFLSSRFGPGGGLFLGVTVFLAYLIYLAGTNTFALARVGGVAGLVFIPITLAISANGAPAGVWQDFVTLAGVWAFVKFAPSQRLWAFPGGRLAYVFTVLVAMNAALVSYVLVRRVNGIGYSIGWGRRFGFYVLGSFLVIACLVIPLGTGMHFIAFDPHFAEWKSLPFLSLAILLFTAWPEEFLFRGLLQNLLAKASKSDFTGWWTASILFGFTHITNGGFPNWRYVVLASIAGFFYGWTWRKSGSIFASALVHAAVDVTWHFLFRTV